MEIVFIKEFSNKKIGDKMKVSKSLFSIFVNDLQVAELFVEKPKTEK